MNVIGLSCSSQHVENASGHGSPATNKVGESEQIHPSAVFHGGENRAVLRGTKQTVGAPGNHALTDPAKSEFYLDRLTTSSMWRVWGNISMGMALFTL